MGFAGVAWHDARRARIRKDHPEVRDLYGQDARTQLASLALVAAQFGVARALAGATLGPWLGATLVVGPAIQHALGVLIHEATHNLIAKETPANKVWGLILNLPLGAPAAMEFRTHHLLHHRHLGEADAETGQDTQAPAWAEDAWVGSSALRKLASFTAGRFYWKGRPASKVPFDGWMTANWITSFGAITLVGVGWGAAPSLYLLCSSLLAFGPHTFGARRLSEHFPVRDGQPTNSYYGPLNAVSFNVGYHVEHHDFPNIAWTRIKKLRELAPEEYDELFAFTSWTKLITSYFFDVRYRVRHYVGMAAALGEEVVMQRRWARAEADADDFDDASDPIPTGPNVPSGFFPTDRGAERESEREGWDKDELEQRAG
jgi:sphingolipid 4-desaturase/C4-monooxygenase